MEISLLVWFKQRFIPRKQGMWSDWTDHKRLIWASTEIVKTMALNIKQTANVIHATVLKLGK